MDGPADAPLESRERIVEQHRHEPRYQAPLEDEGVVVGEEPRDDDLAEPLGGHRRADGRGADVDDERESDPFEDERHRERQLHGPQPLTSAHAHAGSRFEDLRRDGFQPRDGVLEDRQEAVGKERDQGRLFAEADERHRDREHRDRRKGLTDVDERAREGQELRAARARHEDPERDRDQRASGGRQAHHAQVRECERKEVALIVNRPHGVPSASVTVADSAPRQRSSESTSRSEAEAGTDGPSDAPGSAASPAVVSDSSRIARSETPVMRATKGSAGRVSSTAGRSYCSTRPRLITATRSPRWNASSMSWVTSTIVVE